MTTTDWRPCIEDVFEHYGARVIPSGREWQKAECPLLSHQDNNPSASVNTNLGKWGCFVCDERGDGLDIVRANEGTETFSQTVARARELFKGAEVEQRKTAGSGLTRDRRGQWSPPWGRL